MEDFIQESEVNASLNKRKEYFEPECGRFYMVNGVDQTTYLKHAQLVSIDYSKAFPYLCDVTVREAVSIAGKVESPAKFEKQRFDYSGFSEDGKFRLYNLLKEDEAKVGAVLDIDSLNERSCGNILERWGSLKDGVTAHIGAFKGSLFFGTWIAACYINALIVMICAPKLSQNLSILCACVLVLVLLSPLIWSYTRQNCLFKIYAFFTIFLSLFAIVQSARSGEMSWVAGIPITIFLLSHFLVAVFSDASLLNEAKRKGFTIGSFNKFVTGDGKSVVITNKFGDDNDFPMEGYIVICPEIRNGDTVVKEAIALPSKWSYSGYPNVYKKGSADFNRQTLHNTPEDKEVVLASLNEWHGIKPKTGADTSEGKNDVSSTGRNACFTRLFLVFKNILSSKSGKFACFALIAWVVNFVFGCEISVLLNCILLALSVLLLVFSFKSSLKI